MVDVEDPELRLIHTADWQIGKVFRFVDDVTMHVLQEARLEAITTIGRLAMQHGVAIVLVAGDIYDKEGLSDHTLAQPLERMRSWPKVAWHLIPGNHDPHRANGVWERLLHLGVPDNVRLHLSPSPYRLEEGFAYLLPATLRHRQLNRDPTAWMNGAATPDGAIRIGLAHGSVVEFGSSASAPVNHISPVRAADAELSYLALGDWHGCRQINPRSWYAGTPEPDHFDQAGSGFVLLVEIEGPEAAPQVQQLSTGHFRWLKEQTAIHGHDDIALLADRLRRQHHDLARIMLDLSVEGTLSLAEREYFERTINQSLKAALCHLRLDDSQLQLTPSRDDLASIARHGVVRIAAERLQAVIDGSAAGDPAVAQQALMRLYLDSRRLGSHGSTDR